MESKQSKLLSNDKATVIQENPQEAQDTVICDDGQQAGGAYDTALTEFFKAQPKELWTVQVIIGVMGFVLGIARTTNIYSHPYPAFSARSGIHYWGSVIYISTGTLSVAAKKQLHLRVVKISFGMNVISAITAAFTIILMSIDIKHISGHYIRHTYENFDLGITGVLLIFSILQFIIAICVSGLACKATCNKNSVVNVALNQGKYTTLPRMESSKFLSTDRATDEIQVNPQEAQDTVIWDDEEEARGAYHNTARTESIKTKSKKFGVMHLK